MNPLKTSAQESSLTYPYPIAASLRRYHDQEYTDHLKEWEALTAGVLPSLLMYLSHLILSDLVSTGKQPSHLYHRIQSVLSRPLMGHYAGFLRETARYYRQENIDSSMPELIDFLQRSEIDCTITEGGKPLIGELVDYRNLLAHGRIDNERIMGEVVDRVRYLTGLFIKETDFLTKYPLQTDEGISMMGWSLPKMEKNAQPLLKVTKGNLAVRPLLLKMKEDDLMLLEDFDLRDKKLSYRGSVSYSQLKKKEVEKGDGKDLFEALKELLRKVRAEDALLDQADWESFRERSVVLTQRTLDLYSEMGKFRPDFYVPRRDWDGEESTYNRFLASDRTLLAISGVQGTGKSALAAHIASRSVEEGHAVLFVNAQRFTFADVEWSGTPYPKYFSDLLHYTCPFDKTAISRIIKTGEDKGKKVILFIDAVNEVDGLTKKWNRFIAMELLLNWISDIAQPGLKVVVTFRLDVYEDFDYLQEGDEFIPQDLNEISYPGNHAGKRWVWELEPFNEEQAKDLFMKLKEKTELGMAPDMSWEQIKEGLGDKLTPVMDNPLIFQIFLRAHHGEKVIVKKERDAIMMRYAEKLTGAYEASKSSWWVKTWRFIKNGQITPKEQLLADIIEKMTLEGTVSLLAEEIGSKTKVDKRLSYNINSTKKSIFNDLKEGALISEEKIEVHKEKEITYSRRITFTGELLIKALAPYWEKMNAKSAFLSILKFGIFLFSIYALLVSLIKVFPEFMDIDESWKAIIRKTTNTSVWTISTSILPLLILTYSFIIYMSYGSLLWNRKTLSSKTQFNAISKIMSKSVMPLFLKRLSIPFILLFILMTAVPNALKTDASVIVFGVIGLIVGFLYTYFRYIYKYYYNQLQFIPYKIRIKFVEDFDRLFSSIDPLKLFYERLIPLFVLVFFIIGFNLLLPHLGSWSADLQKEVSLKNILFQSFLSSSNYVGEDIFNSFLEIIPAYSVLLMILVLSATYLDWLINRKNFRTLHREGFKSSGKKSIRMDIVSFAAITLISIIAGVVNYRVFRMPPTPESLMSQNFGYTLDDDGNIETIFASLLEEGSLIDIYKLKHLKEISLFNSKDTLDASRFPKLVHIEGSAGKVKNLERAILVRMKLQDFDMLSDIEKAPSVVTLIIDGPVNSLSRVSKAFPNLRFLDISEEPCGEALLTLETANPNLIVELASSKSPRLDWAMGYTDNYILKLDQPVDIHTENLASVRRLIMNAENLDPANLRRADSLQWLLLYNCWALSEDQYNGLYSTIKYFMPSLKVIEFMEVGFDINRTDKLNSFSDKDQALEYLKLHLGSEPEDAGFLTMSDRKYQIYRNADSKWGLLKNEKVLIPPAYDLIENFEDGLARVKIMDRFGLIDTAGKILIKPEFDWIDKNIVKKDGKYGIYRTNTQVPAELKYDYVSGNIVRVGDKFGIIDDNGREMTELKFSEISDFFEGVGFAQEGDSVGLVDKNGEISGIKYQKLREVIYIRDGELHSILNPGDFNKKIPLPDRWFPNNGEGDNKRININQIDSVVAYSFLLNNKYGILGKDGSVIIPFDFDYLWIINANTIWVELNSKWGLYSITGKMLTPCIYDGPGTIKDGYYFVKKDKKPVKVDPLGNELEI